MSRAVEDALAQNSEHVFAVVAALMANLGSKPEWDMEDNFETTEAIAALAEQVGLPHAGDQGAAALRFWRQEGRERGLWVPIGDE